MQNPWEAVSLSDYENHMRSGQVMQMQALNTMMQRQFAAFPADRVMLLGCAGGNGLEHIDPDRTKKVYAVDINAEYLAQTAARFPQLTGILACICTDLNAADLHLPKTSLLVADLLIEYIGCAQFQAVVRQTAPAAVSCGIQIDTGAEFVSESPYLHAFDGLAAVHRTIAPSALTACMAELKYRLHFTEEYPLPNGKMLLRMDFLPEHPGQTASSDHLKGANT